MCPAGARARSPRLGMGGGVAAPPPLVAAPALSAAGHAYATAAFGRLGGLWAGAMADPDPRGAWCAARNAKASHPPPAPLCCAPPGFRDADLAKACTAASHTVCTRATDPPWLPPPRRPAQSNRQDAAAGTADALAACVECPAASREGGQGKRRFQQFALVVARYATAAFEVTVDPDFMVASDPRTVGQLSWL